MTTKHRKQQMREAKLSEARLDHYKTSLRNGLSHLTEVGRVLSASNEEKLRVASENITAILAALSTESTEAATEKECATCAGTGKIKEGSTECPDCKGTGKIAAESARPVDAGALAEAYSGAAEDAGSAAWICGCLLDLMSDEADEPDQLAILQTALTSLMTFMTMEVAEIGTPDDDMAEPMSIWGWESVRKRLKDSGGRIMPPAAGQLAGWVPLQEGQRLTEAAVKLTEGALDSNGVGAVKIIAPGWGSSGYYAKEVLQRDGPKVFPAGTKMFWDHPTLSEEHDRPERSLRDMAGTLTEDAYWDATGMIDRATGQPAGPGLYAAIKAYEDYVPTLNEIYSDIGVSIRAYGKQIMGEAEGQTGPIITDLVAAESVDFVTTPGAGGQVLSLFEAVRQHSKIPAPKEAPLMEVEKDPKFVEERTARLRAEEKLVLIEAGAVVTSKLAASSLPDVTRLRLGKALVANPPIAEGQLDAEKFATQIEEAINSEEEYIATLTEAGKIRGMGGDGGGTDATSDAAMEAAFKRFGLSESQAKAAATGRS